MPSSSQTLYLQNLNKEIYHSFYKCFKVGKKITCYCFIILWFSISMLVIWSSIYLIIKNKKKDERATYRFQNPQVCLTENNMRYAFVENRRQ